MAVKTSAEASANWLGSSSRASQNYAKGIDRVTVNPMELAAAQVDNGVYLARVTESQKKMSANLRAKPMSAWKDNAKTIGAQRIPSGFQKGAPKYAAAANKWHAVWQAAHDVVKTIHGKDRASAIAKATAVINTFMDAAGRA